MPDKKKLPQQANLKYLYNTRKYLFWAGFLGLLMTGILIFSIIPQIMASMELYNDLISENKRFSQLKIKAAQLDESASSLLMSNKDKINQALPSRKPLLELLSGLNLVGQKTQVSFTDISLNPGKISTESAQLAETSSTKSSKKKKAKKSPPKYDVLNLDVTVTGGIDNVNQFLSEIEKIAPFTTIVDLALNERSDRSGLDEDSAQTVFEAKITVTTYFFTKEIAANVNALLQSELTVPERKVVEDLQDFTYTSLEQQSQIRGGGLENLFPNISAFPGLENL